MSSVGTDRGEPGNAVACYPVPTLSSVLPTPMWRCPWLDST